MSFFKKLFGRAEPSDNDGESPKFAAFLQASMEALRLQTAGHQAGWRLGESQRWDFDQDNGRLIFTFPDLVATAPAQIIGSFDSQAGDWMWAWANPSIAESLQRDSLQVRAYGLQHGIRRLTSASWAADDLAAWQMTALAARLCASNGAYRGPAGTTFIFFTFGAVELKKRT